MKKTDEEIREKLKALREQWGSKDQTESLDTYVMGQIEALIWALDDGRG